MNIREQWQLHYQSMKVVDAIEWACGLCGHHIQNDWASRATNLYQILCVAWKFLSRMYADDSEGHSYGQRVTGSFITTMYMFMHHVLYSFLVKHQITQVTQPPYNLDFIPCNFRFFPKLKSPLKGKRFQTIDENSQQGSCWLLGELCEIPRCLLWRELRPHCPKYNACCILFLVQ